MSAMAAFSTMLVNAEVLSLLSKARAGIVLRSRLERADEVATLLAIFSMLIAVGAAAAFAAWLYRALGNIGRTWGETRYSPEYAVWSFLAPGLNLIIPIRAIADGWRVVWSAGAPPYVGVWWGAWILCNVLSWTSAALGFRHDYQNGLAVGTAGDAMTILAAVLGIRVVKGLTLLIEAGSAPAYAARAEAGRP
jgi:hypothetical protein